MSDGYERPIKWRMSAPSDASRERVYFLELRVAALEAVLTRIEREHLTRPECARIARAALKGGAL